MGIRVWMEGQGPSPAGWNNEQQAVKPDCQSVSNSYKFEKDFDAVVAYLLQWIDNDGYHR